MCGRKSRLRGCCALFRSQERRTWFFLQLTVLDSRIRAANGCGRGKRRESDCIQVKGHQCRIVSSYFLHKQRNSYWIHKHSTSTRMSLRSSQTFKCSFVASTVMPTVMLSELRMDLCEGYTVFTEMVNISVGSHHNRGAPSKMDFNGTPPLTLASESKGSQGLGTPLIMHKYINS
jgi:hypothetical protein